MRGGENMPPRTTLDDRNLKLVPVNDNQYITVFDAMTNRYSRVLMSNVRVGKADVADAVSDFFVVNSLMKTIDNYLASNPQVKGATGATGSQGVQGIQGIRGETGAFGAQGATGLQGIPGPAGQSVKGDQGIQGDQGAQGVKGDPGIQGVQGDQGAQGLSGARGDRGPQGIQGDLGAQGDQGVKGDQGIQGIQGIKGDTGAAGASVKGDQGVQGVKGDQGIQGVQGIKGDTGAAGTSVKGDQGAQGVKGDQGTQGPGPTTTQIDASVASYFASNPQARAVDYTALTDANGIATFNFTTAWKSIQTIFVHTTWAGLQMITGGEVSGSRTLTVVKIQGIISRGTLLLSAGPFAQATGGIAIKITVIGT